MTTLSLMEWMKTIIQSLLDLEAECDPRGEIRSGERREHRVLVTGRDTTLTFDLSWKHPGEKKIGFRILTPEGRVIDSGTAAGLAGVKHISRETYEIYDFSEKFLKGIHRAGTWTIQLRGPEIGGNEPEPYAYGVLMTSSLKLDVALNRSSYSTGMPVGLRVSVREEKKRLPATIEVAVDRPSQSLGNWFAANPVPASAFAAEAHAGVDDPLSSLQLKARYLAGKAQRPYADQRKRETLTLFDDGTHGDAKAGDGTYAGRFSGTSVPGTYIFRIAAEGLTSTGERFRRERVLQARVDLNVEPTSTVLTVRRLGPGPAGTVDSEVTIVPRDALGNFLGPGYAGEISFLIKGAKFLETVQDHLDGRYTQGFDQPHPRRHRNGRERRWSWVRS